MFSYFKVKLKIRKIVISDITVKIKEKRFIEIKAISFLFYKINNNKFEFQKDDEK